MFEDFKKINLTIGLPYMSVSENGISFSKTAISKMGHVAYVNILLNDEKKLLAIKMCEKTDPDATPFARNANSSFVRWNNADFLNTLCKMMEWDVKKHNYRIEGEYFPDERAMVFKLKEYKILNKRNNNDND